MRDKTYDAFGASDIPPETADQLVIERLRQRVAVLEEALQFYADPETYLAIGFFPDPPCGEFMEDWSDTGEEYGFRPGKCARQALATIDTPTETEG